VHRLLPDLPADFASLVPATGVAFTAVAGVRARLRRPLRRVRVAGVALHFGRVAAPTRTRVSPHADDPTPGRSHVPREFLAAAARSTNPAR
jgi:hypothetical protein